MTGPLAAPHSDPRSEAENALCHPERSEGSASRGTDSSASPQNDSPIGRTSGLKPPATRAERLVFMGTPAFAVPSLDALLTAGYAVDLIVTALPRRAGRGLRLVQPPVAEAASARRIELFQPEKIRAPESLARIIGARPSAIIVAAYGQILPRMLLVAPPLGCLNVHPSVLPRHRGASPISGAILAGDETTGVSIMLMDEGMDTGPILSHTHTPILDAEDQISLSARLADLGANLLVDTLDQWAKGAIRPSAQSAEDATTTSPTLRVDGLLDWRQPARDLWLRIRAFADWPQGHTWWNGKLLRIPSAAYDANSSGEVGLVQAWGAGHRGPSAVAIGTGAGVLLPTALQIEGGRAIPVDAFLRGHSAFVGSQLESQGPRSPGAVPTTTSG